MVKSTTTKRTSAKTTQKESVEKEATVVVEEKKENAKSVVEKKQPKQFKQSEGIKCRSLQNGPMFMNGIRSSMPYQWLDYGDVVDVEYRDLVAAVRERNGYVMNPWFIIMDDDFLEEYPFLKSLYEKQYTKNDLVSVLSLPVPQMVEEIEKMPKNVRHTLRGIAATLINDGRLDSLKRIKALDDILETDLNLLAEMANE